MKLELLNFQGIIPRQGNRAPRQLPPNAAQTAENVDLLSGALLPIKKTSLETLLVDDKQISAFFYNNKWISWSTDVDVLRSPITNEIFNRIYFTGDGPPKLRALIGATEVERNLGVPAPTNKVTAVSAPITATTWTRQWSWQYENFATGLIYERGVLREQSPSVYTDTIDAVALTNPSGTIARFTAVAHGFLAGDTCIISGLVAGLAVYNDTHTIIAAAADTFDIDIGAFTAGTPAGTEPLLGQVDEVTPGESYRLHTVPARAPGTPLSAIFTMFFNAFASNGSFLGTLYPQTSAFALNRDFILDGAKATANMLFSVSDPQATFDIVYDTSRAAAFAVDRRYVYTFETDLGEEGPPSPPSDIVTVTPVQQANLSGFDTAVPGQGDTINVAFINIYRTATSEAGTFFNFLAKVAFPVAPIPFEDLLTDAELGSAIISTNFIAPPSDMIGIVALPGGFFAGFRPDTNTVLFSEPFHPHAWPPQYAQGVDFKIIGLGVNNSGLVVCTEGHPFLLVGSEPSVMSPNKVNLPQSCSSKRSIAVSGDGSQNAVIYASPDGLVIVQGGNAALFTNPFFRKQDWEILDPASMIAEVHDGKYFTFSSNFTLIVDFEEDGVILTSSDETAAGLAVDIERDRLYLIQGNELRSWRTAEENKVITWKSREFVSSRRTSFSAYRVRADEYTATSPRLRLYGNKGLVLDIVVPDDEAHRLQTLRDETIWEVEIISDVAVQEALISTSMREL